MNFLHDRLSPILDGHERNAMDPIKNMKDVHQNNAIMCHVRLLWNLPIKYVNERRNLMAIF